MTKERKRTLGAYYTPDALCAFLCGWALQHSTDNVLEPSFGGGNILDAAYAVLEELGNPNPKRNIYGCDIDGTACAEVIKKGYLKSHLINKDFLSVTLTDFAPSKFDTIIANPPYVSIRGISKHQVSKGKDIASKWNFPIDGKASLWAYFIIHSLNFLKEKGRMAWVLPKNFLYADYSKTLQLFLSNHFGTIESHDIEESLFITEGTTERIVVLLCNEFHEIPKKVPTTIHRRFYQKLDDFINRVDTTDACIKPSLDEPASIKTAKIGELADIKIGIVTGASKYVVFSAQRAQDLGINPRYLLPIFTKSSNHNTILLKTQTLKQPKSQTSKTLVVDINRWHKEDYATYKVFYDSIPEDVRQNTAANGKEVWYSVANSLQSSEPVCDAFLTPLSQHFPRLMLNKAKVDCTNSLYRVFLKTPELFEHHDKDYLLALLCLSFFNSYSRLSIIHNARLHGKALKLEPSNFKRVSIFFLPVSTESLQHMLTTVNKMVESRTADTTIANFVDDFFTQKSNGEYQNEVYRSQLSKAMKSYGR